MEAIENNSVSEFYAFDSIENAQAFVTGYFPAEARTLGGANLSCVRCGGDERRKR